MKLNLKYDLIIDSPWTHRVKVKIHGQKPENINNLTFFMPSWSPGSYLMREYSRHVARPIFTSDNGEFLYFEQVEKGKWLLDFERSLLNKKCENFTFEYEVYCNELSVRTSHVNIEHAFIQGPSVFMGVENAYIESPKIEIHFPEIWSKISTGLKDVSDQRDRFIYEAKDYDQLIDSPIEIGCQETDGFRFLDKDFELAYWGQILKHNRDIKSDINTIVKTVSHMFNNELPFEKYTFICHFVPDNAGGLEHQNSTSLIFDSLSFDDDSRYQRWLSLVAHEYFHTWNVKCIRPKELGPFNYTNENYTSMLWLVEGLTSFIDDLCVLRSGLCDLESYLAELKNTLNRYFSIPGRYLESLEGSSFNAWIKLYRNDENTNNSTISYYLKGSIVFFIANIFLHRFKRDIRDLTLALWEDYKKHPERGILKVEFFEIFESLTSKNERDEFEMMVSTTQDIDIESYLSEIDLEVEYIQDDHSWLGITTETKGNNIHVSSVVLDGPAYKSGLNAGDEIIAIDSMRVTDQNFKKISKQLQVDKSYQISVSRIGCMKVLDVTIGRSPRKINSIRPRENAKALKVLMAQ